MMTAELQSTVESEPSDQTSDSESLCVDGPPACEAAPAGAQRQGTALFDEALRRARTASLAEDQQPYAQVVYWCVGRAAPVRRHCIAMLQSPWFDRTIMLLIGINTLLLICVPAASKWQYWAHRELVLNATTPGGCGPDDPWLEGNHGGPGYWDELRRYDRQADELYYVEVIFLALFMFEMLVKMIAMGFVLERRSYLRDAWNWLDMIVVVTGLLDLTGAMVAMTWLKLFRTLRPLRAINRVRKLKALVQTVLQSMPQLCRVAGVLVFMLVFFGILGLHLFQGHLRHGCFYLEGGEWVATGAVCDAMCKWDARTGELDGACGSLGNRTKGRGYDSWEMTWTCMPGQQCLCAGSAADEAACAWDDNPNTGINHFDNIGWSMVTIFQSITLEGWVDVMYSLCDGGNELGMPGVAIAFQASAATLPSRSPPRRAPPAPHSLSALPRPGLHRPLRRDDHHAPLRLGAARGRSRSPQARLGFAVGTSSSSSSPTTLPWPTRTAWLRRAPSWPKQPLHRPVASRRSAPPRCRRRTLRRVRLWMRARTRSAAWTRPRPLFPLSRLHPPRLRQPRRGGAVGGWRSRPRAAWTGSSSRASASTWRRRGARARGASRPAHPTPRAHRS